MTQRGTQLVAEIAVERVIGSIDQPITAVTAHSATVSPGALFVAVRGASVDGREFAADAVRRGATMVVTEAPLPLPAAVAQILVADARGALARLAAAWHGHPSRRLRVVGVTGTNGKTTLTYLLEAIWTAAGRRPGVIGTVNHRYGAVIERAATTTPGPCELHALLAQMVTAGVTDVAMEVSSHALTQHRVTATDFDGAIFTNVSHDHLDYHGSMAEYAAAKQQLFSRVLTDSQKSSRFAVLNADDLVGPLMAQQCTVPVTWYGLVATQATMRPVRWHTDVAGSQVTVLWDGEPLAIETPLVGRFNMLNLLAAVAAAQAMQIAPAAVVAGLRAMPKIPGRLELCGQVNGAAVFVDYAHTPDALQHVLAAARGVTTGRVITVFGCGGDRDQTKRPLMGQAAATGSDYIVVTTDNPRHEDPDAIIRAILPGVGAAPHAVIADRRAAIAHALQTAQAGDLVLIAGKGHENYQIIGDDTQYFNDGEVVGEWIDAQSRCVQGMN